MKRAVKIVFALLAVCSAALCYGREANITDQVATAAAALPTVTIDGYSYHLGTVSIPPGLYSYADTIRTDPTVLIRCEHGAILSYAGSADAVNQQSSHPINNTSYAMGGVEGCQWTAPRHPRADVNVIHTGDAMGMHYRNLHIDGYSAMGDTAIRVTNKIYFSEHEEFAGLTLTNNAHGIVFEKNCSAGARDCGNSMDNETVDLYCQNAFSSLGDCLASLGGAYVIHSQVHLRANVGGSGSSVLHVDAQSRYASNADNWDVEGNTAGILLVKYDGSSSGVILNDGSGVHALNMSNGPTGITPVFNPALTLSFSLPGTYTIAFPFGSFDARIYGAGGGGSGGMKSPGYGGGQGAFIDCQFNSSVYAPYTIVVGAGGAGGAPGAGGGKGGDSSVGSSASCTAHGGAKGTTSAGGAGGTPSSNDGPAIASSTGTSATGQAAATGGVPGFCPCGGAGGNAGARGSAGGNGEVFVQQR